MALLDSLLSAIVRAEGDALVMHVGERPYVVVDTQTINISTHGMNLEAMTGILSQLLPAEELTQLEEFGAVEYKVPQSGEDRFSVVAARGGDDIWIEIRRRRPKPAAVVVPVEVAAPAAVAPAIATPEPQPVAESLPTLIAEAIVEVPSEPIVPAPEAVAEVAADAIAELIPESMPQPVAEAVPELFAEPIAEPFAEPIAEPIAEVAPEPVVLVPEPEVAVEPIVEAALEPVAAVVPDPVVAVAHEPIVAADEPVEETVIEPAAEIFSEPVAGAASAPAFGYPLDAVPVFAREMLAHRPDDHESTPVEPTVPLQPEPEPAAQPEPIAELEPERQHNEWGPIAAAVEPIENIEFVEAPIATVELTEPVEQILEEAPKIAALAETLETARVEEILEQAPKIAALVETIEVARIGDVLQEVQAAEAAVVIPMTRTVRIEVPPRTAPTPTAAPSPIRGASNIDRLLRVASARGASALFLTSDSRPCIRLEGDLRFLDSEASLSRADVEGAIVEIAPQHDRQSIGRGEAAEWIAEVDGVGRIRCTTFSDYRGPGMIMRLIATRAATAEQLGLAREIQALATEPQGLVLVAGPRGSGKSTMISALVDLVNRQRAEYVITLERQIRLVHDNRVALVSQREIPGAVEDSVAAARSALRETPDVLVVDDLLSPHMVPVLLSAASEGLLIFVSITAPSTADAVARFVELAPPETRKAVQNSMAESFRGAVAQVLLKKAGGGLVAAREILLATSPVTRVISEGQHVQLPLALENGRKHGMVSFTDTLADFVRSGTVDVREAFRKAPDRPRLLDALKRHGVDTTIVERLA